MAPIEEGGKLTLSFKPANDARWKLIQIRQGNSWITLRRLPAAQSTYQFDKLPDEIAIRHVSPTGILSVPTILKRH